MRSQSCISARLILVAGLCFGAGAVSVEAQHLHSSDCSIGCGVMVDEPGINPYALDPVPLQPMASTEPLVPSAFRISNRWSFTATNGSDTGVRGDPITLTYGVVADGTFIGPRNNQPASEGTGPSGLNSNLQAFLNNNIVVGDANVWNALIDDAYQRWGEISGLTMVRETNDDGTTMGGAGSTPGILGVRADLRIGGRYIDGQAGANLLAYNYTPNNGDLVLDTSNFGFFGNTNNNYRGLRNLIMHEAGHGLGFLHLESGANQGQSGDQFLMEPFNNNSFDGPQHDDILAAHRNYGDALEKNGGNDDFTIATNLGSLTPAAVSQPVARLAIGTDAKDNTPRVTANATDFVSIDGGSDKDVYGFTLTRDGRVTLQLDPRGPTYLEGPQGGTQTLLNTKALADLVIQLLDDTGQSIGIGNLTGAGFGESIMADLDAGSYFALIRTQAGSDNNVQMYELNITAVLVPEPASLLLLTGLGGVLLSRRRAA